MNLEISLKSIGTIHTHFNDKEKMPIQLCGGMEHFGHIVISEPFIPAFDHVEGEIKTGWMVSPLDEIKQKRSDDRFKEYQA